MVKKNNHVMYTILYKKRPWMWELQRILEGGDLHDDDPWLHWIWEPKGDTGKTVFCKMMLLELGGGLCFSNGRTVRRAVSKHRPRWVLFDLCRSTEQSRFNPKILEDVKVLGVGCQPKPVHVVVFAHHRPKRLGERWRVAEITSHHILNWEERPIRESGTTTQPSKTESEAWSFTRTTG